MKEGKRKEKRKIILFNSLVVFLIVAPSLFAVQFGVIKGFQISTHFNEPPDPGATISLPIRQTMLLSMRYGPQSIQQENIFESGIQGDSSTCGLAGGIDISFDVGWNLFALPFNVENNAINFIFGDQLTGGNCSEESDLVYEFDPKTQQFKTSWFCSNDSLWYGDIKTIERGRAYIIYIRSSHKKRILSFAGFITNGESELSVHEGWNLLGNPVPKRVHMSKAGLIESGFIGGRMAEESDQVLYFNGKRYQHAWYNVNQHTWEGDLDYLVPSKGYWIRRLHGRGEFSWVCPIPDE